MKKVIIVGGGVSGIAAASRLYEGGIHDLLVIEAEDRLGGRVHTVDLPDGDGFVELGAQWIHGEEGNVVFEMASARNLHRHSSLTFDNLRFVRSSAETVDSRVRDQLWNGFQEIRRNVDRVRLKNFKTSGHYFLNELTLLFERMSGDSEAAANGGVDRSSPIGSDLHGEFAEWCHQFINTFDGSDTWFDSSASTLEEYWDCRGSPQVSWKEGGYRRLLAILTEKANEMSGGNFLRQHFVTNTRVLRIRIDDDGGKMPAVLVECDGDRTYSASQVIVSVALGVLKENYKDLFHDVTLPEEKIFAIETLGIGTVNKAYLKFPRQWWPDDVYGFALLWRLEDRQEYRNQGLEWLTDVFVVCRVDNAPNVLCVWIAGASSRTMERIEEADVCRQLLGVLKKFLGARYDIPDANYCVRSAWSSNPNFRGSYSFRTPSSDELGITATILSAPLTSKDGTPVILFAGEATHGHYYSTVHGAIESGWREADRILCCSDTVAAATTSSSSSPGFMRSSASDSRK